MQQVDSTRPAIIAWRQLYLTYAAIFKAIERSIAPADVTLPQALAMNSIRYGDGPMTPTRLAQQLTQETQSVTGLLDRMERYGWVRRVRDLPDRRAIRIELTALGEQKLEETIAPGFSVTDRLFSYLKPEEIDQLTALLGRVYLAAMEQLGSDPSVGAVRPD